MTDMDIHDAALAPRGRDRIEWAERAMPVLAAIRRRFPHLPLVEDEGLDAAAFVLRLQRLTR